MLFTYVKGATPLSPDEVHNLIPSHLTIQKQLDEWEQYNIVTATNWAFAKKRTNILSIVFVQKLHKKMFNKTWRWAGAFRKNQTNIGINSVYIPQELHMLFDDTKFWLDNNTYPLKEIAIRLHHRLVLIHPFPNGNGRCSRLMADLLMHSRCTNCLSWGNADLNSDSKTRKEYLIALREADKGDYAKLIIFAQTKGIDHVQ